MSKDWKKIARASGLTIPEPGLDAVAQPLEALEADFRLLARALDAAAEPAVIFRAGPEESQ